MHLAFANFEAGRDADLTVRGMRGVGTEGWALQSALDSADRTLLNPRSFPGGHRMELPLSRLRPGPYTLTLDEEDSAVPRTIVTLGVNPAMAESDLTTLDPMARNSHGHSRMAGDRKSCLPTSKSWSTLWTSSRTETPHGWG